MKQYNCRNCGAPVTHLYNHHCEYCGGILDFNLDKKETEKIDWNNITRIEFIDCYRDICSLTKILKFKCIQYAPIQFIETNNNYSLAKIPENKEFYFAIGIEETDFYNFNDRLNCIRHILFAKIPNTEIANMAFYDYIRKGGNL